MTSKLSLCQREPHAQRIPVAHRIQSTVSNADGCDPGRIAPNSKFIRLDQVLVEFGVMWGTRLTEWDELLPGDIYRFPLHGMHDGKTRFSSSCETVGQLVLMDDFAKTVEGRVLAQTNHLGGSCFWLELPQGIDPAMDHVLIDKDVSAQPQRTQIWPSGHICRFPSRAQSS